MSLLAHLPFSPTVRPLHALTYLFGVPLFSIAFLVFLNSSLSFLLTNLFSIPSSRLGSIVGTLGFVDELVAIFAAPIWGFISDGRIGTRGVSVLGYIAIALSLILFVEVPTVYPGLIISRIIFSLGAAAVTTMVSAILPEMTTTSADVELTSRESRKPAPTGKLAGLVGLCTGLGAVGALGLLLPLPARFAKRPTVSDADAVRIAYFIVAALAGAVAVWCALGLPPPRDAGRQETWRDVKTWVWTKIWGGDPGMFVREEEELEEGDEPEQPPHGLVGLVKAAKLGWEDGRVGVAYVGGFVARAASVGISLFIPLYVNHYYVSHGQCKESGKNGCRKAYILAATLTGTSQLTALLLAPVFGYLTDRCSATPHLRNLPIVFSSIIGILGFTLFAALETPEHPIAFFYAALTGASQIGAIVTSLGLLGQGIINDDPSDTGCVGSASESQALLPKDDAPTGREAYKGSIAGVYSLTGAAAILLLTKVGGKAFDERVQAPFWMLAGFNGLLGIVGVAEMGYRWWKR